MPSSIPYDHPSLVLGNIINPLVLQKLKQIAGLQAKIDAAQDKMNSHVALKRSMQMTIDEMIDMNVDVSALQEKLQEIDDSIVNAAIGYTTARLTNETGIQEIKEQIADLETDDTVESPVELSTETIKQIPLSSDSIKLDAQYFSYDDADLSNSAGVIEKYIKDSTSSLGGKASSDISRTASAQISLQQKNHSLSGTLIITASCTHKNAALISPWVLDVDKAIAGWNKMYPAARINTADEKSVYALTKEEEAKESSSYSILSGVSYGSSFVGMVHILKQDLNKIDNMPSLTTLADSLQERLTIGNWLEEASGGFGIDTSFSDDIKNLLNTQRITAHVTIVVMGCIPSIRSNQLQMGVQSFADFDSGKLVSGLSSISNATSSEKKTVDQAASAAKTGGQVMALQSATIQSVMTGLGKIDQGANKTMDINSMMVAFEDYLQEVKKGASGVPVGFYLKTISQRQLAQLWMDKYYPDKSAPAS